MIKLYAALIGLVVIVTAGLSIFGESEAERTVADSAAAQADAFLSDRGGAMPPTVPPPTSQTASAITSESNAMKATLHTNQGPITIELMRDDAPQTVANFEKLARAGFYDGTKFHRVIAGFMIQGGDPQSKDEALSARWGTGGPGYTFADEIHANNRNAIGTISMANAGPNTNGSQFFINTADNNFLDGKHTVFGIVTAGMEAVKKIESTKTGPMDRPVEPMIIERVTIE